MTDTTIDLYPDRPWAFEGRGVWELGEDGDWGVMVEGHGPAARAALEAHQREVQGSFFDPADIADPTEKWVIFRGMCGCTEEQHAAHQAHREAHSGDMDFVDHCERDCKRTGLPPCDPDRYAWAWDTAQEGDEGAVPVLEVRW